MAICENIIIIMFLLLILSIFSKVLLQDFQHIVAHPDILPELVALRLVEYIFFLIPKVCVLFLSWKLRTLHNFNFRGLMKKRFPNVKTGTLAGDVGVTVAKFLNGISYQAIKDEYEKDFGQIDAVIGKVSLPIFFVQF